MKTPFYFYIPNKKFIQLDKIADDRPVKSIWYTTSLCFRVNHKFVISKLAYHHEHSIVHRSYQCQSWCGSFHAIFLILCTRWHSAHRTCIQHMKETVIRFIPGKAWIFFINLCKRFMIRNGKKHPFLKFPLPLLLTECLTKY